MCEVYYIQPKYPATGSNCIVFWSADMFSIQQAHSHLVWRAGPVQHATSVACWAGWHHLAYLARHKRGTLLIARMGTHLSNYDKIWQGKTQINKHYKIWGMGHFKKMEKSTIENMFVQTVQDHDKDIYTYVYTYIHTIRIIYPFPDPPGPWAEMQGSR